MARGGGSRRLLWLLAGLVLVAACAAPPGPAPAPPGVKIPPKQEAAALLDLGDSRLAEQKPLGAADAFSAALKLSLVPEQKARAYWGLARAELAQGKKAAALGWLGKLFTEAPVGQPAVEGSLLAARLLLQRGKAGEAAGRLRRLLARPPAPLSADQRFTARLLLAEALSASGEAGAATAALMELAQSEPDRADQLMAPLAQAASRASAYELEPLVASAARPGIRAALLVGLTQAYLNQGRLGDAERSLNELRSSTSASRWSERITELDRQIAQARLVSPRAVGVVLPLSGPYAEVGRQVLAAVQLGLGLFGGASAHPPTLYIADSAGDAQTAAAAVTSLVQQRRVMALIGPLAAGPSLAAARQAQKLGVPIITLTGVRGVTQAGNFVFQNTLTPRQQVRTVLDRIMGVEGLRRVAVLAPNNAYGKGFARLIAQLVAAGGGEMVRTEYYPPTSTDFSGEIKKLVSLPPGNYRPGRPDSPKPVINFNALYLPDGAERAAMVAPQLAYWDVNGVQLMGTSLWHSHKLLEIAGRYLNGCVFPDAFDPADPRPEVRRFVSEFMAAQGREPNLLEASAYDAAVLIRRLLDDPMPPRLRSELRQRLESLSGVDGVCGVLSIGPERQVQKPVKLFTIEKGGFAAYQGPPPAEPAAPTPGPGEAAAAPLPPSQSGQALAPTGQAPAPTGQAPAGHVQTPAASGPAAGQSGQAAPATEPALPERPAPAGTILR